MLRRSLLRRLFALLAVLLTLGVSALPANTVSEEEEGEHGCEEASAVLKVTAPRGGPPLAPAVAPREVAQPRLALTTPVAPAPRLPLPRPPIPRLLI